MAADPNKLKKIKEIGRSEILFSAARVPNSTRIYAGASDFKIYDFDLSEDKPEPNELVGHNSYVTGVVLAGKNLVSCSYDGQLIWWDRESGAIVRKAAAHDKWIRGVSISPDGKMLASVSDDMVCKLWDAESGKLIRELHGHQEQTPNHFPSMLFAGAISPDGKYIATGDKVGHVVVWEAATGNQVTTLETPTMYTWDPKARLHSIGGIRSLAFSPDGALLAVGGMGQVGNIDHLGALARVEIFDWRKGEQTHEFPGDEHKGLVEYLSFHPDGDWLLAAGGDHGGFFKFFDLEKKKIIKQDKAPMHVHDLELNEALDTIYAVGHNKIAIYELKG
jgi:WD40 repeat protein